MVVCANNLVCKVCFLIICWFSLIPTFVLLKTVFLILALQQQDVRSEVLSPYHTSVWPANTSRVTGGNGQTSKIVLVSLACYILTLWW